MPLFIAYFFIQQLFDKPFRFFDKVSFNGKLKIFGHSDCQVFDDFLNLRGDVWEIGQVFHALHCAWPGDRVTFS